MTGWLLLMILLVTWQVVASIRPTPELPSLTRIADAWWLEMRSGTLLPAFVDTVRVTLVGFAVATAVGVIVGFLMGRFRPIWAMLEPTVELLRQTPVTALFPLLILYFGIGEQLKVVAVALVATFPILLSSYTGARNVAATMTETARTFKLSWLRTQWEVALPCALPYVLVGMRQALGIALVVSVVASMLAGNTGVGYYLMQAQQVLNVTALFAGILSTALVGYLLNQVFLVAEYFLTRWQRYGTTS
ncbi:ABC transporter permease [Nocardioides endophyticus]|uniref:ABC transporter permease n=1 Tax=Nocardioides endophyticus TaxID=1353775 RepID=A0ABP8Y9X3_9ACTN